MSMLCVIHPCSELGVTIPAKSDYCDSIDIAGSMCHCDTITIVNYHCNTIVTLLSETFMLV